MRAQQFIYIKKTSTNNKKKCFALRGCLSFPVCSVDDFTSNSADLQRAQSFNDMHFPLYLHIFSHIYIFFIYVCLYDWEKNIAFISMLAFLI